MKTFFLNNEFTTEENSIPINDRGLLLGDGLFETIRLYAGRPVFLKKHWNRLVSSAELLEIPLPMNFENFENSINELIAKNGLTGKEAGARVTLTRGSSARGLSFGEQEPTFFITTFPYENRKKDLSAFISNVPRNEYSPLAKIKSLNYLDNILARREAEKLGFDEAILLNTKGYVCETAAANIFFIKNSTIFTPKVQDGALPGITREIVVELAREQHEIQEISSSTKFAY